MDAGRPTDVPPERRPRAIRLALAAILALALAVRLVHFASLSQSAFPEIARLSTESDMHAHLAWSDAILAGDLLGRDTYHHYTEWMRAIAPPETWQRWWGGKETFHREPLYVYFLALVRAACGRDSLAAPLLVQLVLGALQPLVAFALARALFDVRAGLLAAGLTALYGPFVFFQGALLRDWLPPIVEPLVLVLALRARERGRTSAWLTAGMVLGVAVLFRATMLLFVPLLLAWIAWDERARLTRATRPVLATLSGVVLALLPLFARNAIVGAPLFGLQNRAPEAVAGSNAADARPIGITMPASLPAILEKAHGRMGVVVRETLATYRGDWAALVRLQWLKLHGLFDPVERADNLDYGYGLSISPVLRACLTFGMIAAPGVAGLALARRRRREQLLVLSYLAVTLAGLMAIAVIGRYRLTLAGLLIVYAAGGFFWVLDAWRGRRRGQAALGLASVAALIALRGATAPAVLTRRDATSEARMLEYQCAAQALVSQDRFEDALGELERLRTRAAGRPKLLDAARFLVGYIESSWTQRWIELGRPDQAREHLSRARAAYGDPPQAPSAWFTLGRLHVALGEREQARAALERYVRDEPGGSAATEARELLAALAQTR